MTKVPHPAIDTEGLRRYWKSPTGSAQAPASLVEAARRDVTLLCDAVDALTKRLAECSGTHLVAIDDDPVEPW